MSRLDLIMEHLRGAPRLVDLHDEDLEHELAREAGHHTEGLDPRREKLSRNCQLVYKCSPMARIASPSFD